MSAAPPVRSLEEKDCPANDDKAICKRFSTHGAICVGPNSDMKLGPETVTWDFNTVKKESDKCFGYDGDEQLHWFLAKNTADVTYVLEAEAKMWTNKADRATFKMLETTSPYCTFHIDGQRYKRYLYTDDNNNDTLSVIKPDKPPKDINVTVIGSGNDVECCINSQCSTFLTQAKIDLTDKSYNYSDNDSINFGTYKNSL